MRDMTTKKHHASGISWKIAAADVLLFLVLTALDQGTKCEAVLHLKDQADFILIPGIFRLTYVENFGAAFGTLENSRIFLLILNGILMLYILLVYRNILKNGGYQVMRICCVGILAGGIGNIADRLIRGYVVDFIYAELIDFPVFNVADCYITGSVALLLIAVFTIYREDELELLLPFGKGKSHDGNAQK